jgi:hypothetical protein
LFIIITGRERNAHFSATNGSTVLELYQKFFNSFISGSCSHGRCVDYLIYSIKERNAFPSEECLSLEEALSGNCTGTATALMGDGVQFE